MAMPPQLAAALGKGKGPSPLAAAAAERLMQSNKKQPAGKKSKFSKKNNPLPESEM